MSLTEWKRTKIKGQFLQALYNNLDTTFDNCFSKIDLKSKLYHVLKMWGSAGSWIHKLVGQGSGGDQYELLSL
jgi:hypothetical protein